MRSELGGAEASNLRTGVRRGGARRLHVDNRLDALDAASGGGGRGRFLGATQAVAGLFGTSLARRATIGIRLALAHQRVSADREPRAAQSCKPTQA
jgi:hypothetical protein